MNDQIGDPPRHERGPDVSQLEAFERFGVHPTLGVVTISSPSI
jgi:hypothetical protein